MSDLFRLATEISLAHANGMRLAHGLPILQLKSKDDHDEICGMCGENVNDPHKPTCPACTAEGKTCEGGIGKWDGLD